MLNVTVKRSTIMTGLRRGLFRRANRLPFSRLFGPMVFRNVQIPLDCGISVRGDLRNKYWSRVARRGHHEPCLERFMVEYLRAGDVVFDVGAHIGILTSLAAKLVGNSGTVWSFEIDNSNFAQLEATIRRNRFSNVRCEKIALANRKGEVTFIRPADSWGSFLTSASHFSSTSAHSSLMNEIVQMGETKEYTCAGTTLDDFVAQAGISRVDMIKIDVDGPELGILQGGASVISEHRPALAVEVSMLSTDHGVNFRDVFDFLNKQGYRVYTSVRTESEVIHLRRSDDFPVDIAKDRRSFNLYCLHPDRERERRHLWFLNGTQAI